MPCYKKKNAVHPDIDSDDEGERHLYLENINAGSSVDDPFLAQNKKEENKEDKEVKDAGPPDGGYGWVIVFGCFLTHVLIGGLERGSGIFFLQFIERYGKSNQLTSWPLSLTSSMFLWFGPVASAICSRYSARASLTIGGLMMTAGLILTSFSNNFYDLFIYFTLLYGFGFSLCYAPSLIIVNAYFSKRMSLAVGLGSSGVGVGTFALVPLLQLLFDTYCFSGAFLILGGIAFHMNLVAMLFRPLSYYQRFSKIQARHVKTRNNGDADTKLTATNSQVNKQKGQETQNSSFRLKHRQPLSCFKSCIEIIFPVDKSSNDQDTKRKLFHLSLLKDGPFFLYCLSLCLFTLSVKTNYIFLPSLMTSRGLPEDNAALAIALSGIFDMTSRILTGMVLDHRKLRPYRTMIYNSFMFAVAGAACILPSLQNFWSFAVTMCTFSLFCGACVCQKSVILVDILGVENMAHSFGILICFQGLGSMIGPPLAGFLIDYLGSYDEAFYSASLCTVLASFLMVLSNIFLKLRNSPFNQDFEIDFRSSLSYASFG